MKQIVFSIAASSLLAALAWAQPAHPGRAVARVGGHVDDNGQGSNADPLVYVLTNDEVTLAAGFGAVHVGSGAFVRIGSTLPSDLGHALAPRSDGTLLSMAYSGKLYSIDPRKGVASVVGATGLGDCSTPTSPCGSNSAVTLGLLNGKYYAIDYSQNLYSLDPISGATKVIGPTGIPRIHFGQPGPTDTKIELYDESLFSFRGKLYANFDVGLFDLNTGLETAIIPAEIYEINSETGAARAIAPTDLALLTVFNVNETIYAYDSINGRFDILDVETGRTQAVHNLSASVGFVCGATPARPNPGNQQ